MDLTLVAAAHRDEAAHLSPERTMLRDDVAFPDDVEVSCRPNVCWAIPDPPEAHL